MSATGQAPAIKVRGLTVTYNGSPALDGLDFTAEPGMVHGLVGMNGAGKSTLFKALIGLLPVAAGTIEVAGGTTAAARTGAQIAYTPQTEAIDWDFPVSVFDVVMMGRYGKLGWRLRPREADRAAVIRALERVELDDLAQRQIGALSGGQRKRAFIARGLAQDAELLLLDEPFAGVDKRSEHTITQLLRELAAEGRTLVVATHDLVAVPQLCDQIALLNRKVIDHGTPAQVLVPEKLAEAFGGFVPASALSGVADGEAVA
jgi:manganese transport system ATP-binding protein